MNINSNCYGAANLNGKRKFKGTIIFFLPLFLILQPMVMTSKGIADENECVKCHTNLKRLMDLSWEVKKIKPKKKLSKEISGEG